MFVCIHMSALVPAVVREACYCAGEQLMQRPLLSEELSVTDRLPAARLGSIMGGEQWKRARAGLFSGPQQHKAKTREA